MKKTVQTLRFMSKSIVNITVIGFLGTLASVAVCDLVFQLTDRSQHTLRQVVPLTVPCEIIAGVFALLIGLILFTIHFKVVLANGISRKTFLLANLPAAALVAVAFTIFNLLLTLVHGLFWPVIMITNWVYPQTGWAGTLVFQLTLYFLLVAVGWFIALVYYRSSVPVKWIVSTAPFLLLILYVEKSIRSEGSAFGFLSGYLHLSMGTPYRATLTFLVYAAILCNLVYLLLRRAPLKD